LLLAWPTIIGQACGGYQQLFLNWNGTSHSLFTERRAATFGCGAVSTFQADGGALEAT